MGYAPIHFPPPQMGPVLHTGQLPQYTWNPDKVAVCLHCDRRIHRGVAGWLNVTDEWEKRTFCSSAPWGKHVPANVVGGRGQMSFQHLERSICDLCGNQIAWVEDIEAWSDIFFEDEQLIEPQNWGGTSCSVSKNFQHAPSLTFITSHLQRIEADLR